MQTHRPSHLPEFNNPPLNEVVLGVQFSPAKGYQQIRAGEVWGLFREEYPLVEEHQALEPAFETFGLPHHGQIGGQLSIVTGAIHNRFWFLRRDGQELIQFQSDRLLHNWRKVGDLTNEYPRFEQMIERFRAELNQLEGYFAKLKPQSLAINQCELSYINHINLDEGSFDLSAWFRGLELARVEADDVNLRYREVIRDDKSQPIGRITYEISTGIRRSGKRVIVFNLTARGAPPGSDVDSGLRFIANARELIVERFAQITSEEAHKFWERIQ